MGRATTHHHLLATLALLVLYSEVESQWIAYHPLPPFKFPPLCSDQLALANRACALLPYRDVHRTPQSPTADTVYPPSPGGLVSGHRHHHRHHQHHQHGHDHNHGGSCGHKETEVEEECCRWVREVDDVCVCGLLVHLPPFLAQPAHNYTVVVDDSCSVTFMCGPRLVPF